MEPRLVARDHRRFVGGIPPGQVAYRPGRDCHRPGRVDGSPAGDDRGIDEHPVRSRPELLRLCRRAEHDQGQSSDLCRIQLGPRATQRNREQRPCRAGDVRCRFRPRLDHQPALRDAEPDIASHRQPAPRIPSLAGAALHRRQVERAAQSDLEFRVPLRTPRAAGRGERALGYPLRLRLQQLRSHLRLRVPHAGRRSARGLRHSLRRDFHRDVQPVPIQSARESTLEHRRAGLARPAQGLRFRHAGSQRPEHDPPDGAGHGVAVFAPVQLQLGPGGLQRIVHATRLRRQPVAQADRRLGAESGAGRRGHRAGDQDCQPAASRPALLRHSADSQRLPRVFRRREGDGRPPRNRRPDGRLFLLDEQGYRPRGALREQRIDARRLHGTQPDGVRRPRRRQGPEQLRPVARRAGQAYLPDPRATRPGHGLRQGFRQVGPALDRAAEDRHAVHHPNGVRRAGLRQCRRCRGRPAAAIGPVRARADDQSSGHLATTPAARGFRILAPG